MRVRRSTIAAAALLSSAGVAMAAETLPGQPHDWQITLQEALSPIEAQIHWFSNYTLAFIIPITILVAALLAWCAYRFNEKSNAKASRTSHNTTIEVIWTLAPVIILLFLAVPSFQLLTAQYNPPSEPELTIKATGYQWYWGYEYQPSGNSPQAEAEPVSFDSNPVAQLTDSFEDQEAAAAAKGDPAQYPRLLAVDYELVVPVDTVIRVLSTSGDVIHSFALPSMGVKVDAVPGRLNEYWFEANREGIFYGQCSELCGTNHANMPIALRVVSKDEFANWYKTAGSDIDGANEQLTAAIAAKTGAKVASR